MEGTKGVPLSSIVKEFKLEVLAQSSQFDQTQIHVTSINRPGLQLMGYYDYFDEKRVQLLGKALHLLRQPLLPRHPGAHHRPGSGDLPRVLHRRRATGLHGAAHQPGDR